MRKGWKVFWITCAIIAGIGFICCIAGVAMGATIDAVNGHFPYGFGFGKAEHNSVYDGGERSANADTKETYTGIHGIDVEVSQISVQILEDTSVSDITVETEGIDSRIKLKVYEDYGELKIETAKRSHFFRNGYYGTVWILLPQGRMDEVNLEIGAGALYVQNIQADSISIEVGAGEATIDHFKTDELDIDCGVGAVRAAGIFEREADLKCGIGSIDFTTYGQESDYNYEVDCNIGEVKIGSMHFSGIGRKKEIYNGMGKEMNVECGVGEISVDFDGTHHN